MARPASPAAASAGAACPARWAARASAGQWARPAVTAARSRCVPLHEPVDGSGQRAATAARLARTRDRRRLTLPDDVAEGIGRMRPLIVRVLFMVRFPDVRAAWMPQDLFKVGDQLRTRR